MRVRCPVCKALQMEVSPGPGGQRLTCASCGSALRIWPNGGVIVERAEAGGLPPDLSTERHAIPPLAETTVASPWREPTPDAAAIEAVTVPGAPPPVASDTPDDPLAASSDEGGDADVYARVASGMRFTVGNARPKASPAADAGPSALQSVGEEIAEAPLVLRLGLLLVPIFLGAMLLTRTAEPEELLPPSVIPGEPAQRGQLVRAVDLFERADVSGTARTRLSAGSEVAVFVLSNSEWGIVMGWPRGPVGFAKLEGVLTESSTAAPGAY